MKKSIFSNSLSLIGLSICLMSGIGAANAGSVETVYLSGSNPGQMPAQVVANDELTTQKVVSVLQNDAKLQGESVKVSTQNGVVTLSGKVRNVSMIYRVLEDAQKTGVELSNINETDLTS